MAFHLSHRWLSQWIPDIDAPDILAEKLTQSGFEVDDITRLELSDQVVIGHIVEALPHPDADRLKVCHVDVGGKEPLIIVCGCKTAQAGLKVAVAQVGTTLPGGMKIKKAALRGVVSMGMLCSATELGLDAASKGIMHWPEESEVGAKVADLLDLPDQILAVDITPNRGDCLSLLGLARDISVSCQKDMMAPEWSCTLPKGQMDIQLESSVCDHYHALRFSLNPGAMWPKTPEWMARRLQRSGMQSLGFLVDVTHYVMLELGQPMHAFSAEHWQGGVRVRQAKAGETIELIHQKTYTLTPEDCVIADEAGVQAIAGVMGGAFSAVDQETREVLLESAHFSPQAIASVGRRHRIQSDALMRFERGVDPMLPQKALSRAWFLIESYADVRVLEAGCVDQTQQSASFKIRRKHMDALLGWSIPDEEVEQTLSQLLCTVTKVEDGFEVVPPSHRTDLVREADGIEEVLRLTDRRHCPEVWPHFLPRMESKKVERSDLSAWMVARGFQEIISYSFISPDDQAYFGELHEGMRLKNPISPALSHMRGQLFSGLLNAASFNLRHQHKHFSLYEIGRVFAEEEGKVRESLQLAGLCLGDARADFFAMKGECEALLYQFYQGQVSFAPSAKTGLHPGQTAEIVLEGCVVGEIGMLHPSVIRAYDLPPKAMVFSLCLTSLEVRQRAYSPVSKFPKVRRDLSFWVADTVLYAEIESTIRKCSKNILQDVKMIDFYKKDDQGLKKSMTVALYFQECDKTLTDEQVKLGVEYIVEALINTHQAEIRTS